MLFNWQSRFPAKPGHEKGYGPSGQGNTYPLTYADLASLWRVYGGKSSMTCYPPPHAMVAVKQQTRNSTEFNVTYEANGAAALYHYVVTPISVQTTPDECLASPLTFPAKAATMVLDTTSRAPGEYRIAICPQSAEIPTFVSGDELTYGGGGRYSK